MESKKKAAGHPVDRVAWNLFPQLIQDFRDVLGHDFATHGLAAWEDGVASLRDYEWPTLGQVDVFRFKAYRQLELLFKRHTFIGDTVDKKGRAQAAIEKFDSFQQALPMSRPTGLSVHMVLQEARKLAREILGPFELSEAIPYMKIGGKATLGGPREKAYLDLKLGDPKALTCPSRLRKAVFEVIGGDPTFRSIIRSIFRMDGQKPNLSANVLDLVPVPKSWKIDRLITPLTLLGLFWSYGVGGVIEKRLCDAGLDIRRLSEVHKRLAKKYSVSKTHVTADLVSGSDGIMRWLLMCILPREWYRSVKLTFVDQLAYKGSVIFTNSALPMGNAATFPVETLVFYCLIKAIGNLAKVEGVFSVFGDDLIYPRRIHKYVAKIFPTLGLNINGDKTFVNSNFRESCGGDYYHGCDVRPALLPENTSTHLRGLRYQQYLYKILNSLLTRWDEAEIPRTVAYLESEIIRTSPNHKVLRVPLSYPPTAGKQVDNPFAPVDGMCYGKINKINYVLASPPFVGYGDMMYTFDAIVSTPKRRRPVLSVVPYYWEWLRSTTPKLFTIEGLHVLSELGHVNYRGYHEAVFSPLEYRSNRKKKSESHAVVPMKEEGGLVVRETIVHPWAVGKLRMLSKETT